MWRALAKKSRALRASVRDDGKANRTPSAWMIMAATSCPLANSVLNRVLSVGHFKQAEVGHFCLAPKSLSLPGRRDRRPERYDASAAGSLHPERGPFGRGFADTAH